MLSHFFVICPYLYTFAATRTTRTTAPAHRHVHVGKKKLKKNYPLQVNGENITI